MTATGAAEPGQRWRRHCAARADRPRSPPRRSLWLWGGVAGAVFGCGWPPVRSPAAGGVLVSCPAISSDPAARGRRQRASGSPDAVGFYAALALLAARRCRGSAADWARLSGLADAARASGRGRSALRRQPAGGASAGSSRAVGGGRLALGRHRGRLLYAEQRHALVAFGPPQSGKSAGLAIPGAARVGRAGGRVLDQDRPARGDLRAPPRARAGARVRPVRARRATRHTPGRRSAVRVTWDGALRSLGGWRRPASSTSAASRAATSGRSRPSSAWRRCCTPRPRRRRDRRGRAVGLRTGRPRARRGSRPSSPDGCSDAGPIADAHGRVRRGRGVRSASRPDPLLDRGNRPGAAPRLPVPPRPRSAHGCEITPDRLLDEALDPVPDRRREGVEAPAPDLPGAAVRARRRAPTIRPTRSGGRLELPLLLCLDEAGNVAPLPNLAEIASTAPSHNIQLVSIFHDLAQARSRYRQAGPDGRSTVTAPGCCLPGVADLDTLRYFSGLVGDAGGDGI